MPTTTVHVVAAGIVRGDGTNRGPVLNNLAARTMVNGELRLRFNEYRPPSPGDKSQYLVTVTAVTNDFLKTPSVSFLEFRPDGLALRVFAGSTLATMAQLKNTEFMIEISILE